MRFAPNKLPGMKINSFIVIFAALVLSSCFDAPNYPDTPKIEYKDVLFKDVSNDADSLIIVVDFEDGDGDLGLSTQETSPPFNLKNYFSNATGNLYQFGNEPAENLMTIKDLAKIDTLPPYEGIFRCIRWDTEHGIQYPDGSPLEDTVYFQFNKRYSNIYIDFLVLESGTFQKFDWRKEIDCSTTMDGRFPMLNETPDKKRVLEGTLRYSMPSYGFNNIFGSKTMKLRIQIVDRAGHFSNIVETPEFTLSDIRVN